MRSLVIGLCLILTLGATAAMAWTVPSSVTWTLSGPAGQLYQGAASSGTVTAGGMSIQYAWDHAARTATGLFQGSSYNGMYAPFVELLWTNQTATEVRVSVSTANTQYVWRVTGSYYTTSSTILIDQFFGGTGNVGLIIPAGASAELYVSMGPPAVPANTTVTVTYGEIGTVGTDSPSWGAVKSLYND